MQCYSPFYDAIFESNEEMDPGMLTILQVMCTALVKYFWVAVKEFLPGGEFEHLDANDVKGVPTHNKFPERMFGYWKMLMMYMPNVGALTAEAFTLFALNNTYERIKAKGDEERHAIIPQCQKDVPLLRKKYKERQVKKKRATFFPKRPPIPSWSN